MSTENADVVAPPAADDGDVEGAAAPTWAPGTRPVFNSPAADLNQLRNEAKRIADAAPGQPVHDSVLARARALAAALEHDIGLPQSAEGFSYADLAVLLSQSR